ncbi:hypothetical protein [Sphingomonas faeni]|uniref:hypothetical protein n=1 Tax=Sphingomonas faeni TaxID=185950 RepID=UPI003347AC99
MSEPRSDLIVAVAFAHTAEVLAWSAAFTEEERELLDRTLRNLLDRGHVAGFSVKAGVGVGGSVISGLRSRIGSSTVDMCSAAPASCGHVSPAFLMPVWPFDHMLRGAWTATAQLLGLDLELIATPSPDEELGAHLPGRDGLWLIHAGPMF